MYVKRGMADTPEAELGLLYVSKRIPEHLVKLSSVITWLNVSVTVTACIQNCSSAMVVE